MKDQIKSEVSNYPHRRILLPMKLWTLQECVEQAKHDEHVAACEYLDCPNQKNEIELRIAGSAFSQLQKLAKKALTNEQVEG